MAFKDPSTSCGGLSFNPLAPTQFAVATADPIVRLYDIRKREGGSFHCHDGVLQEFYHPGTSFFSLQMNRTRQLIPAQNY